MSIQRYSVTPQPIETLLTWVKSGEIAIPEIQRPFVWDATAVRNLLDSLYRGYPVGYLIAWRNPTVRLKDGTSSAGKRILIDGQQRVTALMAALLGQEVLTRDYETVRVRIGFHPLEERFEVANPAIRKDPAWLPDIAELFGTQPGMFNLVQAYAAANGRVDVEEIFRRFERLRNITNNHVGIIELAEDLDIGTVTEIFIRVNSYGTQLNQADFAMSKIAANTNYGGQLLRKAIDYFCHLAVSPEFYSKIQKNDPGFAASEFLPKMAWLRDTNDDLYDPSYGDMLRVAFTSEFKRGRLQDLVALLSGRNFETKGYEAAIAEDAFARLKKGVLAFMSETHFKRFVMILRSAGFVTRDLIGGQNAVNSAYIVYLGARAEGLEAALIEALVRRWFVMALLTGRYAGTTETGFDFDIRQIEVHGTEAHVTSTVEAVLAPSFWSNLLPQQMETSSANSPYFKVFVAAQVKLGDPGFLSRDIKVHDLVLNRSDVHHVFPRDLLKKQGLPRGRYNQIANYVLAQSEINIAIGNRPPETYFGEAIEQAAGGSKRYGAITDPHELEANLASHCIPAALRRGKAMPYDEFLSQRRQLMAERIRQYVAKL
jgi:hypothetical protein